MLRTVVHAPKSYRNTSAISLVLSVVLASGCGSGDEGPASGEPAVTGCQGAATVIPRNVQDVVDLVNALPKPLDLACWLESLPRPLDVYATTSNISAQQTLDPGSPRIFVFVDPLILSVVPVGLGADLLELAEQRAMGRSIKAEIEFPVEHELSPAAPFEQVMFAEDHTGCAFCHAEETLVPELTFTKVYESRSLRPVPSRKVELDSVVRATEACDESAEPERCALLRAVFAQGDVRPRDFPVEFAIFD